MHAPPVVVATVAMLVFLHALSYAPPPEVFASLQREFVLYPGRFFAPPDAAFAYPSEVARFLTLFSTALIHADWSHLLVNVILIVVFGRSVANLLGKGWIGASKWMLLFAVSVVCGSILYLVVEGAGGAPSFGASGGASGILAAGVLVDRNGRLRSLLSREFIGVAAAFAAITALLTVLGPLLLGGPFAWEAHAGGFLGGAAMMIALTPQHQKPRLFRR